MTTHKFLPTDLIDSPLADYRKPEHLTSENRLLKQLTKALVERVLQAEITEHLGHDKHETVTHPPGNGKNGKNYKHQTPWAGLYQAIKRIHHPCGGKNRPCCSHYIH